METVNTELEMLRVFLSRNGAEEGRWRGNPDYVQEEGGPPHRSDSGGSQLEESVEQPEEWTGGHGHDSGKFGFRSQICG